MLPSPGRRPAPGSPGGLTLLDVAAGAVAEEAAAVGSPPIRLWSRPWRMFTYCRTGTSGSLQKLKSKVSATPVLASASRPPVGAQSAFTLQLGMQSTSSRPI